MKYDASAARWRDPAGQQGLRRFYPDPWYIAHSTLFRAIAAASPQAHGRLLDIGCGRKPYRDLFPQVEEYVGVDLPSTGYGTGSVDVLGDGQRLPFRDASFDTVFCSEVLEHVPEPGRLVLEVARILKPGGTLILTTPQTWGLHEAPHDYFRYTEYGLRYLVERAGLAMVLIQPTCGVWATTGQRTAEAIYLLYAVRTVLPVRLAALAVCVIWQRLALALDALHGHWGEPLDHLLVARKVT